jgi:hypothetical protein
VFGEDYIKRIMRDVYVATYTSERPPQFEHILSELIDMGIFSVVFYEHAKKSPERFGMSQSEADEDYYRVVEKGEHNEQTLDFAIRSSGTYFWEEFERDIEMFMNSQNYSFLIKDVNNRHKDAAIIKNAPIISVW